MSRGEISLVAQRHQEELKAARSQAKQLVARNALASRLSKHQLGLGSAEQLGEIWADQVEVDEQAGNFTARSRDFKPVDRWVAEQLSNPAFSHFLAAGIRQRRHQADQASRRQRRTTGFPWGDNPRNLGEALTAKFAAQRAAQGFDNPMRSGGSERNADGMVVAKAAAPFGLKPLR